MIELAMHDELDEMFAEPLASGAIRLHLAIGNDWHELREHFAGQLNEAQLAVAYNLLADDNAARAFERTGDMLIIRAA